MSALDQAIIKAYAKDRPVASAVMPPPAPLVRVQPSLSSSATAVEDIYRDGALYRLHTQNPAATVPAPHLTPLPPTSPRRNIRRSLLRLMAAGEKDTASAATESPPRIARKVIIRHVSHSAPPPPMGLLRSVQAAPSTAVADLLPETIVEEQEETSVPPPAKPATPEVAPLNVALEAAVPIDIAGRWLHEAAIAPMMIVADGLSATMHPAFVQQFAIVDGLAASVIEARVFENLRTKDTSQTASSRGRNTLDLRTSETIGDSDLSRRVKVYIDGAHASGRHRPHARFRADADETTAAPAAKLEPETTGPSTDSVAKPVESDVFPRKQPTPAVRENEIDIVANDPLPFGETFEHALASDLIPVEPKAESATAILPTQQAEKSGLERSNAELEPLRAIVETELPKTANEPEVSTLPVAEADTIVSSKTALPVWEVDCFQWPRTCDKLLGDAEGYLATAGDKLFAAVQDGLKVLAITGTRRGEGRSTLALCLARAAASSGIDVALMDADFLRPQLASKLGLETAFGWQDAALGKIPLSEAAVKSLADGITVMPLESAPVTRRLSLADPRVTATIRAAAATFDLLILDLGPSGPGQQVLFPPGESCPLDAAIVVRDLRFTAADEAEAVGEMLHAAGIEAVGVAENFVVAEEIPVTSV